MFILGGKWEKLIDSAKYRHIFYLSKRASEVIIS